MDAIGPHSSLGNAADESRSRANEPWSAVDDVKLFTGYWSGASFTQIARALQRYVVEVESRLQELGVLEKWD